MVIFRNCANKIKMTPNIYIYSRSKQSKAKQNKGGFNINWNKIRQNTKKKEKRIGYV